MFGRREFIKISGAATMASFVAKSSTNAQGTRIAKVSSPIFDSSWESLKQYRCPTWYSDAKFGIWSLWGPQAVPKQGDWYARNMYIEGSRQYKWHVENYGHPSKFGYKDIIPLWKAEKWEPEHLMRLFKKTGAKYFGLTAGHHDNFDLWNSKYQRWNAVNMGPKRDVVGLWRQAALKQDLKFGLGTGLWVSYHWFSVNKGHDKAGPYAGVPYDGNDPRYQDLYLREPAEPSSGTAWGGLPSPDWWHQEWFRRIQDLVDNYQPDILSTDGPIPFGEVGRRLVAHYYNENMKRHGGTLEAVFNAKNNAVNGDSGFQDGTVTLNIERGVVGDIYREPWQCETSVGDWFYKDGDQYKSPDTIIDMLADVVSKNGNLKLYFVLRPDGTLDEQQEKIAAEIAEWMVVNGDAIYGTRPWKIYGEGPTQIAAGAFAEKKTQPFTAQDIRFTTKGELLYAIVLDWPGEQLIIKSLSLNSHLTDRKVASIRLMGADKNLSWTQSEAGLVVELPRTTFGKYAYAFQIAFV
jgi:alpha-L-fucosidase